jgi:hypothetical protein
MADNQDEKFSTEEAKFRDEVNELIEKAYPGRGINEIIELKIKNKRGTYYNNVKKRPLTRRFIKMIREELGIDISILNNTENDTTVNDLSEDQKEWMAEKNKLLLKIDQLQDKLLDISEKKLESLDDATREIITLNAEVRELRRKIDGK